MLAASYTLQQPHDLQYKLLTNAKVAELADAPDLGSGAARRGGSSPPFRTKTQATALSIVLLQAFCTPDIGVISPVAPDINASIRPHGPVLSI